MALVSCKECGEKVSTKAKACPKCGAKGPKKTSVLTWILSIFIFISAYTAYQSANYTTAKKEAQTLSSAKKPPASDKPIRSSQPWSTSTSEHTMTGEFSGHAQSSKVAPSRKMDFPYGKVVSWMAVGCNREDEWIYLGFNQAPNLVKYDTKDGYDLIRGRIKWGGYGITTTVSFIQGWGSKFIHFQDPATLIDSIDGETEVTVELKWHGEQPTFFKYSLYGSSKAISKIRTECESAR